MAKEAIRLRKGERISLSKFGKLNALMIGLGWVERKTVGVKFDLDASVFMLNNKGKVPFGKAWYFVFYNQEEYENKDDSTYNRCIVHQGDEQEGSEVSGSDVEQIMLDLTKIPPEVHELAVIVTIDEAEDRSQTFGQVDNAFIRLVNAETDEELLRFDLTEDSSGETAMIFAKIYRAGSKWKFAAVGQGHRAGFEDLVTQHGLEVEDD
ncbi:TerD family protein [Patescibacteria group bacterium]